MRVHLRRALPLERSVRIESGLNSLYYLPVPFTVYWSACLIKSSMPVLDLPYLLQRDNHSCGFIAALMVIKHLRGEIDEEELFKDLGTSERGTSQTAIIRELRRRSVAVNPDYNLTFPKVRRQIVLGRPVITYRQDLDHWMVIYGYRRMPNRAIVANPIPGKLYQVWLWERVLRNTKGFGLVCSEKREFPLQRSTK